MTSEPSKRNGVSDSSVTRVYRESATERAPTELDARVLRDARAAADKHYSRSIGWLRPMAWAATVGLSLAIVLELSNVPQPDEAAPGVPVPAASDDRGRKELPEADANIEAVDEVSRNERSETELAEEQGRLDKAAASPEPVSTVESRQKSAPPAEFEAKLEDPQRQAATDLDAFRASPAPMLQEAADMARMRDGPNQEAEGAQVAAMSSAAKSVTPCDESQTAEPEAWLACIEDLDAAGRHDEAELERKSLQEAFPDFEMP